MRMLIVEDDPDALQLLQMIVGELGTFDTATTGGRAVSLFEMALDTPPSYELILLDIMLPEMDGRTALRRIREIENERGIGGKGRVNVVMVTALDDAENVIGSFFRDGCEAYVTKPFRREALLAEIKKLIGN